MVRFYLYIKAGRTIDRDTEFFKVAVGQSDPQLKLKAWLEAYAIEHGHLFSLWNYSAQDFFERCMKSIGCQTIQLRHTTGAGLKRYLQTGEEDPACYQANLNRHRMLMKLDSKYYAEHCIFRKPLSE